MIESHRFENGVCIVLLGEQITLDTRDELNDYLRPFLDDEGIHGVILNFSNVRFIDSSGFGWIAKVYKTLHSQNRKLALCHMHHKVVDLLKMVGLDQFVEVYPSEREAKKIFRSLQ